MNGYLPQVLFLLEIGSVACVLLYLYFASKRNPKAWLYGIVSALLSAILFYHKVYFASMVLNLIYAIQGVLGYYQWRFLSPNKQASYRLNYKIHLIIVIGILAFSVGLNRAFEYIHFNELLFWDILLAIGSIVATYLEIKKETSCWWYWIICNTAYGIFYLYNASEGENMYLYAGLMFVLAMFSFLAKGVWEKAELNAK